MTNLQRGNVKTQANIQIRERTIYELAGQGELYPHLLDGQKIDQEDENGYTLLHWAAAYGQLMTIKMLLSRGANLEHKGKHGETALAFAACKGHVHVIKFLLTTGVNVDKTDEVNCY